MHISLTPCSHGPRTPEEYHLFAASASSKPGITRSMETKGVLFVRGVLIDTIQKLGSPPPGRKLDSFPFLKVLDHILACGVEIRGLLLRSSAVYPTNEP